MFTRSFTLCIYLRHEKLVFLCTFYTNWCCDQDISFVSHLLHRFYVDIMPPKQKPPMEKLKLQFTKIYNDMSSLFDKEAFSPEDIARLKSSLAALNTQFQECNILENQLRELVIKEIDDEDELDSFFDEVNEVKSTQRGKLTNLNLLSRSTILTPLRHPHLNKTCHLQHCFHAQNCQTSTFPHFMATLQNGLAFGNASSHK